MLKLCNWGMLAWEGIKAEALPMEVLHGLRQYLEAERGLAVDTEGYIYPQTVVIPQIERAWTSTEDITRLMLLDGSVLHLYHPGGFVTLMLDEHHLLDHTGQRLTKRPWTFLWMRDQQALTILWVAD